MKLWQPSTIRDILNHHNLRANKRFGQNFLIDKNILDKIVAAATIAPSDHILEIGPGLGTLTQQLLSKSKNITVVELDQNLLPILKENFGNKIKVINQDILTLTPPNKPYKIVANIPYNITSPILNHFLQAKNPPQSMTLLIQKEVAEKIITRKKHSILSLQVALFADSKLVTKVSKNSFFPAPKVDSAVIHLTPHQKIPRNQALKILNLARTAFSQKRKKIKSTLDLPLLQKAKISPDCRAEDLTIQDWITLSTQT